jgi:hypothetical protein
MSALLIRNLCDFFRSFLQVNLHFGATKNGFTGQSFKCQPGLPDFSWSKHTKMGKNTK